MKLLVLGAGGMAGHIISLFLREKGFSVDTLSANKSVDKNTVLLDVTDSVKFRSYLDLTRYDAVINCIGLLVKQSDSRKDLATYLNSFLPHFLENYYNNSRTKVIHLSTDCVFSGKNPPYREDSLYDGDLFYDRTKALGEIINVKDLTFRMSIIGPEIQSNGTGLFNWFMNQTGTVEGYTGAIWNGITTLELAKGIEAALIQNLTGLYHLVPAENISKYELLNLFKEVFKKHDVEVKPKEGLIANKTLLNTRQDFDFSVSNYQKMVLEMKEWISTHEDIYSY